MSHAAFVHRGGTAVCAVVSLHRMRYVVLVPVLGLLLAGCSGGEADPQPSSLPPVTASPSPTVAALEVPPSAQAATPQGAAAFVSYYYEELGRAFASLDTTRLRQLSASSCTSCEGLADAIDRERASGRRYAGGEITVRTAEAIQDDPSHASVTLVYDRAELVATGAGASSPRPGKQGITLDVGVVRSGTTWKIEKINELSS